MTDTTPRLELPFLFAGQAQKELTHNEALQRIDLYVQAVVEDRRATPPAAPQPGQCWLVDAAAAREWAGQDGAIVQWTGGGWRYAAPFEGMAVWHRAQGLALRHIGGEWSAALSVTQVRIGGNQIIGARQSGISAPSGGAIADTECRTAVVAILAALQAHGLIAN